MTVVSLLQKYVLASMATGSEDRSDFQTVLGNLSKVVNQICRDFKSLKAVADLGNDIQAFENAINNASGLISRVKTLDTRAQTLEKSLQEATGKLGSLRADSDTLSSRNAEFTKANEVLELRVSQLENDLRVRGPEIESANEGLQEIREQIQNTEARLEALKQNERTIEGERKDLIAAQARFSEERVSLDAAKTRFESDQTTLTRDQETLQLATQQQVDMQQSLVEREELLNETQTQLVMREASVIA